MSNEKKRPKTSTGFCKFATILKIVPNRDICKVQKRQHQYPEFGHTQGEIKKLPAKKYIGIQGLGGETQKSINFDGFLSFNQPRKKKDPAFGWPTQLIGPHVAYITLTINYFFQKYLFIFKKEVSLSPILYFKISTIEE
jgi:hypothetical protein